MGEYVDDWLYFDADNQFAIEFLSDGRYIETEIIDGYTEISGPYKYEVVDGTIMLYDNGNEVDGALHIDKLTASEMVLSSQNPNENGYGRIYFAK